ncbi:putative N-acetylmuramoyl-L-alanine amidase YrvJ [Sporosarcina sp. NCCP-2716]|uniref:N-acetylmuramoyl-L-alanine amidase n=1 Tax=Sporosarcina sp. NCCP-2716 TaxID=2943679 RepID=UPI0020403F05|nr:N-acetylmuramoyl-L-alanine amidase [Sporosarcina sp. NCCP-2716]GKV68750.1 putative N-acetylmuramoyl-L-alanine amidase YrvJ [Sporosarcina sp. NCCP-2716]
MPKLVRWMLTACFALLAVGMSGGLSMAASDGAGKKVIVHSPTLNIRSGPGLTYSVTGTLTDKTEVQVIDRSGEWLEISHEGKTGWIASWLTSGPQDTESNGKTVVSRVDSLNIRSAPSTSSAVIGKLRTGEPAKLLDYEGEWASIITNGTEGWVHTTYISEISTSAPSGGTSEKSEAAAAMDTYTVIVDKLNVRKKATQTSKRIGTIRKGESYPVERIDGNWVKLSLPGKKSGWVYAFHGELSASPKQSPSGSGTAVSVVTNGTNIRTSPSTTADVAMRADAGETFSVRSKQDGWYEIGLADGRTAFIAEWVVSQADEPASKPSAAKKKKKREKGTLKGITVAIDPGHGGNDRGTTGTRGTDEKDLTLLTAELLSGKLKDAGAQVVLTRDSDTYVSLQKRTEIGLHEGADVFVSLHYDANPDRSISGFTTYYTQPGQQPFAAALNDGLAGTLDLNNRGTQSANYLVLRENRLPAVLIELGFLSNSSEERVLTSPYFREQAAQGIYKGLLQYFDGQ